MSNKTTAILTFLVSTVIPFIQDVVDFIDMFRTGSKAQSYRHSRYIKTKKTLNITLNAFDAWYYHLPYM
jgi:hypothetical protein